MGIGKMIKIGTGIIAVLAAIERYRDAMQQMTTVQRNLEITADQVDKPGGSYYQNRPAQRYRRTAPAYDRDRAEWEQRMREPSR